MNLKEETGFSWIGLFFATAICFFVFSIFIKIINGNPSHTLLFLLIGCISVALGMLSFIAALLIKRGKNGRHSQTPVKRD